MPARRSARIPQLLWRHSATALTAMVVLAALLLVAPAIARHAGSGAVAVADIEIVGTPKLYVERPGAGAGYNAAWVVFRTRPHLHISRQVVVELRGLRGRSYRGSGAPNCVRSTVIQAARLVRPGHRYRVRFYVRPGAHGTATTLRRTTTLTARRFAAGAGSTSVPHC